MTRTYRALLLFLVLCWQAGCISFQVRNPAVLPSSRYLPPWKWIQVERRDVPPRGPHLSLFVDRDFIFWSCLRNIPPERRVRMKPAEITASFLREVEAELNAPALRAVWSKRFGISLPDKEWPVYRLSDDMKYLLWKETEAPPEALQNLSQRAYRYACVRLDGHSKTYTMRSQIEEFAPPPDSLPETARAALQAAPHVPSDLLRVHKWTCESGHQHEEYYVLDNGLAWILDSAGERRDAQEFDPALEAAFTAARRKAKASLKQGIYVYWTELGTILKEEYGIKWRCPGDLNLRNHYD